MQGVSSKKTWHGSARCSSGQGRVRSAGVLGRGLWPLIGWACPGHDSRAQTLMGLLTRAYCSCIACGDEALAYTRAAGSGLATRAREWLVLGRTL